MIRGIDFNLQVSQADETYIQMNDPCYSLMSFFIASPVTVPTVLPHKNFVYVQVQNLHMILFYFIFLFIFFNSWVIGYNSYPFLVCECDFSVSDE